MTEQVFQAINARFPLTKLDAGQYARFKASPLSVELDWYAAEGLGNVSFLHGKAMGGLMQMDTLVIDPFCCDAPLFSYDFISAMGNITVLTEYYDTLLHADGFDPAALAAVKASVAMLPDHDLGAHWYDSMKLPASFAKKTKKAQLPRLETAFSDALDAYLALAAALPVLDAAAQTQKREKASAYVNGLLTNGGPSTDAFSKALGKEQTRDLFARIVFGTEAPHAGA